MSIKETHTKELECITCHTKHWVADYDDLYTCIECDDELIRVNEK